MTNRENARALHAHQTASQASAFLEEHTYDGIPVQSPIVDTSTVASKDYIGNRRNRKPDRHDQ
jgi:hypothetical protein